MVVTAVPYYRVVSGRKQSGSKFTDKLTIDIINPYFYILVIGNSEMDNCRGIERVRCVTFKDELTRDEIV